jgi:hypothetical protein
MTKLGGFLALLLVAVAGCRMGGDTGVVDSVMEAKLLAFELCDGTTTREEILLRLGAPTAEFEKGRLTVHRFYVAETKKLHPISWGTNEALVRDRRLFDLVLVFDNDVVCRHTLVRLR